MPACHELASRHKTSVAALVVHGCHIYAMVLSPARAQQYPDDQYIVVYSLMQQADSLNNAGQPRQALAQIPPGAGRIAAITKCFPDSNPKIVNFRLNYLVSQIAGVTARLPRGPRRTGQRADVPATAPPPRRRARFRRGPPTAAASCGGPSEHVARAGAKIQAAASARPGSRRRWRRSRRRLMPANWPGRRPKSGR